MLIYRTPGQLLQQLQHHEQPPSRIVGSDSPAKVRTSGKWEEKEKKIKKIKKNQKNQKKTHLVVSGKVLVVDLDGEIAFNMVRVLKIREVNHKEGDT